MNELLAAALRYAARGWEVFPCHTPTGGGGCSCGEAACENQGKHPRVAWKGSATTDPAVITGWWERWPDANIGIATGARSGIVVVDADGSTGLETLATRDGTEGGPRATTGRGEHRYLAHPGVPVKNFTKRDGLDLRGDGGYVIAPPSLHWRGNRYAWADGTEESLPPELPVWLLDLTRRDADEDVPITPIRPSLSRSVRTTAYAGVALEREITHLSESANGTRNHNLNAAALKLGHIVGAGWLDRANVEHALLTTALALGLPRHEATATITSGMTAGMKEPAVLDERPDTSGPAYGLKIEPKRISKGEQAVETASGVHWMERIVDAADYPGKVFDPLVWAVPGLLPEGCFLFAGAPKTGKSWVALQIGYAVATGGLLFGKIQVPQAAVLYLDLESNQRRMKSRLSAMIGDDSAWPDRGMLSITNEIDRLPDLIDRLDEWMVRHPLTRLVIIDIFENVRPDDSNVRNPNLYRLDYHPIRLLTHFADTYHITVLLLHHTNKMHSPDNQFNKISGSTGLTGATSGAWVMGHAEKDEYILKVQGRDLENSDDLYLRWDAFLCRHILVGNGALYSISDERKTILSIMDNDQEWSPRELADETGKPANSVAKLVRALVADGFVEKASYGKYVKVRQKKTYGLVNISPSSPTGPSGSGSPTGPSGPSSIEEDPKKDRLTQSRTEKDFGQSPSVNRLESHKNDVNGQVGPVGPISYTSDVDHDQRRVTDVQAALLRHDFKAARRAAATIRGRKTHDAVEEMIDTAEAESQP